MSAPQQIPFDLIEAEAPSFENFVMGDNDELVTHLYALSSNIRHIPVTVVWSGARCGKSHLLNACLNSLLAQSKRVFLLKADGKFLPDPFADLDALLIDDADQLTAEQQDFAFKCFLNVTTLGGTVFATGSSSPAQWPIRDDLRTRLASGVTFELKAPHADAIPNFLREHAQKRGFALSDEVLTYLLTHEKRDVAHLSRLIYELDRWSLASKRRVTVPLARDFLTHRGAR